MRGTVGSRGTLGIAAAAALLALGGCSTPAAERPQEPRDPEPAATEAPPQDRGPAGEESCLLGQWALDLPDYAEQSTAYLLSVGIPLDGPVSIGGTYTLGFGPDGIITIGENLVIDASVMGNPIMATNIAAGSGEWSWADTGGPALVV